jgi:ribokinase
MSIAAPDRLEAAARQRVLVVGSLNMDTILESADFPMQDSATIVERVERCPGGHAGNCSAALAALGFSVRLLASVGQDEDGASLLEDLTASGIDISRIQIYPAQTGQVFIPTARGSHFMLLWRGANDLLSIDVENEIALFSPAAVVLFDPPVAVLDGFARLAKSTGLPVLYWCPGPVNARDGEGIVRRLLPALDVIVVNRAERDHLGELLRPGEGLEMITTLGPDGAECLTASGREHVAGVEVEVVDTVGSGDAFLAAYLLGRQAGLPLRQRMILGNGYAALAATGRGARGGLVGLPDLIRFAGPLESQG